MEKSQQNNRWKIAGLALLILLILAYCWYSANQPASQPIAPKENATHEIDEGAISADEPRYAKETPPPVSDPFASNSTFEVLKLSNDNKADFDFTFVTRTGENFDAEENIPVFNRENGNVIFDMTGKLLTGIDLENKVPLSIEFHDNKQLSLTRRVKLYGFDFPFVKENEKVKNDDKLLYSFDFNVVLKLEPGLYYFLIVPTGRNRILNMGKFMVR